MPVACARLAKLVQRVERPLRSARISSSPRRKPGNKLRQVTNKQHVQVGHHLAEEAAAAPRAAQPVDGGVGGIGDALAHAARAAGRRRRRLLLHAQLLPAEKARLVALPHAARAAAARARARLPLAVAKAARPSTAARPPASPQPAAGTAEADAASAGRAARFVTCVSQNVCYKKCA